MNNFACLFKELDETTDDNIKTEALVNYFNKVPPCDSLWAISLLLGRKIKRVVSVKRLKQWAVDLARTPQWLFDECFESVRDLAETAALILPYNNSSNNITLQILIEEYLLPLRNQDEVCQKEKIISIWQKMDSMERYIWNKLLTGTFRVDITSELVIKAFSSFCGLETAVISHRLSVNWEPSSDFYEMLISSDVDDSIACSPFSDTPEFKPESEPEHIPFSVNAVLLYARMGQGRGFSVFMEYTFAIWHNGMLVPFAKTSKGLSDEERIHMESFIYNNTIEKFGPVRSIKPELIFELEFDGVQESPRHKSGVIALSPRISRWCHDKNLQDVASLDYIKSLIDSINH